MFLQQIGAGYEISCLIPNDLYFFRPSRPRIAANADEEPPGQERVRFTAPTVLDGDFLRNLASFESGYLAVCQYLDITGGSDAVQQVLRKGHFQ